MKTYLGDEYDRVNFKEEATSATIRKNMAIFMLNVLNDAICQPNPNRCSLGYWLVDEHLYFCVSQTYVMIAHPLND